jgi:ribosome-associated toxin RatA of RatAB toxin-antitoxin module
MVMVTMMMTSMTTTTSMMMIESFVAVAVEVYYKIDD